MSRETFQSLRMLLMEKLDLARELTDEEILEEIDTLILERMRDSCLSLKEKVQLRQELFHSVRKLDVLQELIEDETVTEIMVNGPDAIFVERAGKLSRWEKTFTSGEKLEDVIQQIVGKCNRVVNESMPIVDARLENGARVNAVVRPVALNGPILTIRRFPDTPITMEKLIALGSLPAECAEFLKTLVRARYSMVIGGGTLLDRKRSETFKIELFKSRRKGYLNGFQGFGRTGVVGMIIFQGDMLRILKLQFREQLVKRRRAGIFLVLNRRSSEHFHNHRKVLFFRWRFIVQIKNKRQKQH